MPRRVMFDVFELEALKAMLENGEDSDHPEFWRPLMQKVDRALLAEKASLYSARSGRSATESTRLVAGLTAAEIVNGGQ